MATTSTLGVFPDISRVSQAVGRLRDAGYPITDISVLYPLTKSKDNEEKRHLVGDEKDRNPQTIATGATYGAIIGSVFGGLLGGAAAIAIPGIGPMMAVGPMIGALAGGLAGGLVVFDMPHEDTKQYEGRGKAGGVLVSVPSGYPERTVRARRILCECGAPNPVSVVLTREKHDETVER